MTASDHGADGALIPGWDAFVDRLRALPEVVVAKLPERVRGDPRVRADFGRKMQSALVFSLLDSLAGDPDYPFFRPGNGFIFNFGQPNADTIYRLAKVEPEGTYRLRGKRGNLRVAIVAQRGPFPCEPGGEAGREQPGPSLDHHDLNALPVDSEGWFDVILSQARPDGHDGEWWRMRPDTNKLWFRGVNADWTNLDVPTLSIERLDIALGGRPRPSAEYLADRLHWLGEAVTFYAGVEMAHIERMREAGFLNDKLTYYDTTEVVGLEGQFYFECAYELAEDEALIVEAKVPPVCEYWSAMLTDEVFETIDWHNNHSALNDTQGHVDADGVVRFVISAKDPACPTGSTPPGIRPASSRAAGSVPKVRPCPPPGRSPLRISANTCRPKRPSSASSSATACCASGACGCSKRGSGSARRRRRLSGSGAIFRCIRPASRIGDARVRIGRLRSGRLPHGSAGVARIDGLRPAFLAARARYRLGQLANRADEPRHRRA